MGIWRDGVIPVTVKRRAFDVDGRHLLIEDDDTVGVLDAIDCEGGGVVVDASPIRNLLQGRRSRTALPDQVL